MIIGRLKGVIDAISADSVLIDVNGVGYVAQAGSRLLSKLQIGEPAVLHIETKVTESAIILYAFASDQERAWFVRMQDVPGVAGKAANAILDAMEPSELMDAIMLGDNATIQKAKGVGKKLAERIIGELSGKPPPLGRFQSTAGFEATSSTGGGDAISPEALPGSETDVQMGAQMGARRDALSALTNLGYGQSEAARAIARAIKEGSANETAALIKAALKVLSP
mgnify:CR=1 FL=1